MKESFLVPAAVMFLLSAGPAVAHHSYADPYCPKGTTYSPYPASSGSLYASSNSSTYQVSSNDFPVEGFVTLFFIVLAVAVFITAASSSSKEKEEPAVELLPMETPEDYDQQAARKRAYARLLDADAVLIEAQTRLALKQDEQSEVGAFLRDKNSGRRG